jgi:hypothetical protein
MEICGAFPGWLIVHCHAGFGGQDQYEFVGAKQIKVWG